MRPGHAPEPLEERLLQASVRFGRAAEAAQAIVLTGEVSGFEQSTRRGARGTVEVVNPLSGTAGVVGAASAVLTEQESSTTGQADSGVVVLWNARGSVRLTFNRSSILVNYDPQHVDGLVARYEVVGGTGAFAHATGQGELSIKRDAGPYYHLSIESQDT